MLGKRDVAAAAAGPLKIATLNVSKNSSSTMPSSEWT